MIPVVNDQHKYMMLYSAKVGCTSMRILYLAIHANELSAEQHAQLDGYHNVNELQPYEPGKDYSDYTRFLITRNPYARVVSAFIDQYVYAQNDGVQIMLSEHPPENGPPQTFIEFLEYLNTVPDGERDSHFQTQSYFAYAEGIATPRDWRFRLFKRVAENHIGINYCGDISGFNEHMRKVYSRIFRANKAMKAQALAEIDAIQKHNSSFYGPEDYDDAAILTLPELDELRLAPKPQDFFNSARARELVHEIYADDFHHFGYQLNDIPKKRQSAEIDAIPDDLNWQMYLRLNPDLPPDQVYNERTVIRHYLEFGRFEDIPRAYKIEAPEGFDWQRYLALHDDLPAAGIATESAAIEHYISYGIRENREIE